MGELPDLIARIEAARMSKTDPVAHLETAIATTRKIIAKANDAIEPLAREMRIMKWKPEYQAIMWEAVMLEAKARMENARS